MQLFLAAVVMAAATPKALPSSASVFFAPRVDQMSKMSAFFSQAGASSALLRPEAWRDTLHPLGFDVLRPESLKALGIDASGPLTASQRSDVDVSCLMLVDPPVYHRAMEARLLRVGTLRRTARNGVSTVAAVDALGRVLLATVTRGKDTCAVVAHGTSAEAQLPAVATLLTASTPTAEAKALRALPGTFFVMLPSGRRSTVIGVSSAGRTATLEAVTTGLHLAPLAGAGPSPVASLSPPGLGVVRLRLAPASLPAVLEATFASLPVHAGLKQATRALAPLLTGNAALFVHRIQTRGTLRTTEGRFAAVRGAVVAEVGDATAARQLIDALDASALAVRGGALFASLVGTSVVLANDEAARDGVVAALQAIDGGAPKRQTHAVEFTIAPERVARGLAQVPLLDAVQDPALAGVLAVGTELGPVLLASEAIAGWVDAAGPSHRMHLEWTLRAPTTPDAGPERP